MAIDFSSENFTNIGGFTLEHLRDVLWLIKRENTTLDLKSTMPYNSNSTKMPESSFFTAYFSTGLIYVTTSVRIRFLNNNTFNNIWLIDRKSPFQKAIGSEKETGKFPYINLSFI